MPFALVPGRSSLPNGNPLILRICGFPFRNRPELWGSGLYFQRRYTTARPRLYVDVVSADGILREGLAAWFEANTDNVEVVGKFASWADTATVLDHLSDVVIIDVLLGDQIPLSVKVEAIVAAGAEAVVCSEVTTPALIRHAYQAGAKAFVPKTSGAQVLSDAVLAAAKGEQTVLPELSKDLAPSGPNIRLTAREHEAVLFYLGEGLSTARVGERLGISANGVKKLLVSARRKASQDEEPLSRLAFRDKMVNDGWLPPDRSALRTLTDHPQGPHNGMPQPESMLV